MSLICNWNEVGDVICQVSSSPFCTRPFWRMPIQNAVIVRKSENLQKSDKICEKQRIWLRLSLLVCPFSLPLDLQTKIIWMHLFCLQLRSFSFRFVFWWIVSRKDQSQFPNRGDCTQKLPNRFPTVSKKTTPNFVRKHKRNCQFPISNKDQLQVKKTYP